jgi:DsbC/DsbD-like thiol-disulfide interchange protein
MIKSLGAHFLKRLANNVALVAVILSLGTASCFAAKSDWIEAEGGAMRVVLSKNADGSLNGFVDISLQPGWKTYWKNPGDGGIPPSLTLTNLSGETSNVQLQFPAPEDINENEQRFAGYHTAVALPFQLPTSTESTINLTAFIGVCAEICVPFEASFALPADSSDADKTDRAFKTLPQDMGASFFSEVKQEAGKLILKTSKPEAQGTLFFAPEDGWVLGHATEVPGGFSVDVLKVGKASSQAYFTLRSKDGAISGTVPLLK